MITVKIPRDVLERCIGVFLRVPSLFVLEMWFRTDAKKVLNTKTSDMELLVTVITYMALILAIIMATLPLKRLVILYMYLVGGSLILLSQQLSSKYTLTYVSSNNHIDLKYSVLHISVQCCIAAAVSYLIKIKDWTRFTSLVFTLPMFAQLASVQPSVILAIHNFASFFTLIACTFYAFNKLGYVLDYLKNKIIKVTLAIRALGWLTVALTTWHRILLPVQLIVFWSLLFTGQFLSYRYFNDEVEHLHVRRDSIGILTLMSIGNSCATPVSLIALCVSISYLSYCLLVVTKIFLQGWYGFEQDRHVIRGWDEGVTMLLIAVQTEFLSLNPLERAYIMSILLFIVLSSLIQSMYDVTEPVLLALAASNSRDIFKHIRTLVLCTFLWIFPLYMTSKLSRYFDLDFMLLVIVSSCLITSVRVWSSLIVYALFLYDSCRTSVQTWTHLDDFVYYTKSITRIAEFIVAVVVVVYGAKECIFGTWSWINSSILIIHCYFNIWKKLQDGWRAFLLRREAVKLVSYLPDASASHLEQNSDVCPICFEELVSSAKVTPCSHIFHSHCLKKWLYVRDTCPMCQTRLPSVNSLQCEDSTNSEHPS